MRRQQLKRYHFADRGLRLKSRQFFKGKKQVTSSNAAPGDTELTDATVDLYSALVTKVSNEPFTLEHGE